MSITIATKKPSTPEDADFAIYIDFKKDIGNPQRIFQSSAALITAFEKLDKILCETVDSKISPVMMIEEIEIGSLKYGSKAVWNRLMIVILKTLTGNRWLANIWLRRNI